MNKTLLIAAMAALSTPADAGLLTFIAATDAASAARSAATAAKSGVAVQTGPNSVMCRYEDGACLVEDQNLSLTWHSHVTPAAYANAAAKRPVKVSKLTYFYLNSPMIVIEWE